jgi:hypothetical protein
MADPAGSSSLIFPVRIPPRGNATGAEEEVLPHGRPGRVLICSVAPPSAPLGTSRGRWARERRVRLSADVLVLARPGLGQPHPARQPPTAGPADLDAALAKIGSARR